MPYTGPNDPNLPANIKNLPTNKKSQFVKVFNSSFANCQRRGGGGCEAVAFKFANGAIKTNESDLKPRVSKIDDYFSVDITEASFDEVNGKKEILVTLLREGPGNKSHNNYYTKSALKSALKEVQSRPKQYYNHAKDVDNPDRDLRDWASSIQEAWVDETEPKAKLKARVKVLDNWLWERAKSAPTELAVSIEGKGAGKSETIEGQPYHAIYEIQHVNGVNWVDYPGNAGMGVQVLEKDKSQAHDNKEENDMTFKDILEGMKGLSGDELKEMASKPELKEFFMFGPPEQDEKTKGEIAELKESLKTMKAESEAKSKEFSDKVVTIEKEKAELSNKVEAHEIKGKEMEKDKLVEKMLGDSKLKDEHKTDTFKKQLIACEKEEDIKILIEDREKICVVKEADTSQDGAGSGGKNVNENDQHKEFTLNVFGTKIEDEDVKVAVAGGIE